MVELAPDHPPVHIPARDRHPRAWCSAGINLGCTDAAEQSYYYDGAHYADCTAFVDDTIVVFLSSIAPDAAAAASGAADGITEWLGSVTASAG